MTFASRHIGPDSDEQTQMLKAIGYASLDDLMDAAVPESIRWHGQRRLVKPRCSSARMRPAQSGQLKRSKSSRNASFTGTKSAFESSCQRL